jgi:hypothetical protein
MAMKILLTLLGFSFATGFLPAADPPRDASPERREKKKKEFPPPRWFFLGEDKDVEDRFNEVDAVVMLCVYDVEAKDSTPTHSWITFHSTAIRVFRGDLKTGDRIQVRFFAEVGQKDFSKERAATVGSLKLGFLRKAKAGEGNDAKPSKVVNLSFDCEWLELTDYSTYLESLLLQLQKKNSARVRKREK